MPFPLLPAGQGGDAPSNELDLREQIERERALYLQQRSADIVAMAPGRPAQWMPRGQAADGLVFQQNPLNKASAAVPLDAVSPLAVKVAAAGFEEKLLSRVPYGGFAGGAAKAVPTVEELREQIQRERADFIARLEIARAGT